ncbi:hypothetical protein M3N64_11495 [Sporolactobacillus sp. CPB3-1]|uniref:DUF2178 domain-containing protein n=1 Tax=Sporolactobacillus mangiferae TaxID=2940498 RepID=A0ABT0MCD3_9BACL|nr:hypothetical protein [Sporolactobacillus mangiferae]MCL1632542.1 hypothetical protein [Sporolactobacillus mangiferae]
MRIYHKRNFAEGLFFGVLFLSLIIITVIGHKELSFSEIALGSLSLLISISFIMRSLSKKSSAKDLRDEKDERNRLIEYKVAMIFEKIVWNTSLILTIIFAVLFAVTKYSWLIWPLLGSAILFNVGFVILLLGSIYFERNS